MTYYLGIDGGGTKTRSVLGDGTKVLATGTAGGSNMVRLGEERARAALHAVIRQVCTAAKISASEINAVCIGASGAGRPEVAAKISEMVREMLAVSDAAPATSRVAQVMVVGDMEIALEAAFGAGPGVIAIAGTGSIVFGRDGAGRRARAGGWGFAISDEGSGHWIGREAVSAVVRAYDARANDIKANDVRGNYGTMNDRGGQTALTAMILEEWKLADIDALIQFANSTPPPEFPRLFRVVLRAAEQGGRAAHELLARAGRELALLAEIVVRRIAPAAPYVPVATTGSVFRQSEEVRRVFYDQLTASFPGIDLREDFVEPVMGALALARNETRIRLGDR
jgi:glucosamine kinase